MKSVKTKNYTFRARDSVSSTRSFACVSLKVVHSARKRVRYSSHAVESGSTRRYQKNGIDVRFPSVQRDWKRKDHAAPTAVNNSSTSTQERI